MGMHMACVIVRDTGGNLKKRTYITFTGKAAQDVAAVMVVYKFVMLKVKFVLKCFLCKYFEKDFIWHTQDI